MRNKSFKKWFYEEPKTHQAHKWYNTFDIYERHFEKYVGTNPVILEIGVEFGGGIEMLNYYFDNQEGGVEGKEWIDKYVPTGKYDTIQNSFKNEFLKISKKNKIIVIYPIPEVGWSVPRKLNIFFKSISKTRIGLSKEEDFITTSYKVYQIRNKASFELFDSIKTNGTKPHRFFCLSYIKKDLSLTRTLFFSSVIRRKQCS